MSHMTARRPSELIQGSVKLASAPVIYERLMEVIDHPRGGSADVAKVVLDDTALTARLLKVVNSAFFSFPRPVETVSQAVAVVGTSQIRDLALATSVVALFKDVPEDLIDMDGSGVTAWLAAWRPETWRACGGRETWSASSWPESSMTWAS